MHSSVQIKTEKFIISKYLVLGDYGDFCKRRFFIGDISPVARRLDCPGLVGVFGGMGPVVSVLICRSEFAMPCLAGVFL